MPSVDWVFVLTNAVVALFVYDICKRVAAYDRGGAKRVEIALFGAALFLLGSNFMDTNWARRIGGMLAIVVVALVLEARDHWRKGI